ncbi:MAG: isoleucine--tRNA ligase [Candidatus Riflebacteria bacterium]|nr:isoleucine--tRNA ligase [Candidatus Riflebacteria bacterium]
MAFKKTFTTIDSKRDLEILDFWKKEDIFQKSINFREGAPSFIFYEGPPTANGTPHPGHVLTKAMKDLVPRYKTMCGCQVKRKAGWDTHGLPVELEVEKQLGMNSKQDIEKYGIENFIKKCRESVFKYEAEWRQMVERGGFWVDMDDPYITCSDEYVESVWWILSQFWKEGLLYEGHKVVPYCPRCGTALSSHEVSQGYDEAEDPSVVVRFAIKNQPETYFLVWTTTPWTLISNVALAVGSDIDYVKVSHNGQNLILAEKRLEILKGEGEVVAKMKGRDLLNTEYVQLYPFVVPEKRAHYVIAADFVSTEDGTGIVHIAPAFGEDDYRVGQANDLPVMQPVDLSGKFTDLVTPWKGRFVKDADSDIIADMKKTGKLFSAGKIKHTYPFCWRCDSPLLYYARHSWFIRATAFKDEVLKANDTINWFPAHVKEGRFKNFLDNMIDWAISRDRYWGTPLPIWTCKCGEKLCISSISELKKLGKNVPEKLEPHKPYVDEILIPCPKCSADMKRVNEVIDCWFDSGAMHTAQWHYPFENKETFNKSYPADFICEAVDQTRGWFYSLLVTGTFLYKKSPYKNVVVLGLICDKNGLKMSKSKGNVLDCMKLFDKYGADAVRWSLYSGTAPWNTRRFYEEAISESQSRFLGTLQNVYSFFVLYANTESFNPFSHKIPVADRPELDRWLISRLNNTILTVRKAMDSFEVTHATTALETFVDDLSNWYVRRSRRRFWMSGMNHEQASAFLTLWEALVETARLVAPFVPFISEDIYRNLVGSVDSKAPQSVHLNDYPVAQGALIDETLERRMDFARKVVGLGRAARNESNLKVRQPLADMKVVAAEEWQKKALVDMQELIFEELNVKKLVPIESDKDLVKFSAKPNFRSIGQGKYKAMIPKIKAYLEAADGQKIKQDLDKGQYSFQLEGQEVVLVPADVELSTTASGEMAVQSEGTLTVALNKTLTRELVLEGLARELVNKIQFMRKEKGFEVSDRITFEYKVVGQTGENDINDAVKIHSEYLKQETLALNIHSKEPSVGSTEWNINGIQVLMNVIKESRDSKQ